MENFDYIKYVSNNPLLKENDGETKIQQYKPIIDLGIERWKNEGFNLDDEDEDGNTIYDYVYDSLNSENPDWLLPQNDPDYNDKIDDVEEEFSNALEKYLSKNPY